jgi:hypothetical protein
MRSKISDKDVLQLFTSLKSAESTYPQDMIQSRRDAFAKQAAAMAALIKAGGNGAGSTGTSQAAASTGSGSTTAIAGGISIGSLLETVLVIAIVAEAGVAAYVYREKIAEFINSTFDPKVEQTANPNNNSSPDLIATDDAAPEITESPEATTTVVITETPIPPEFVSPIPALNQENNNNIDSQVVTSTPNPNNDNNNDKNNNGLHLGQTKQPTKEAKPTKEPKATKEPKNK